MWHLFASRVGAKLLERGDEGAGGHHLRLLWWLLVVIKLQLESLDLLPLHYILD